MTPSPFAASGRVAPVMLTTLLSQGISAFALLSLPLLGAQLADGYSFAVQVGGSALASIALGVVYNLAIGRPGYSRWALWIVLASVFSVLLGVAAAIATPGYSLARGLAPSTAVLLIFSVGGGALAAAGINAVRLACLGRPLPLAGVTIVPNLAMLLGSLYLALSDTASEAPLLPAVAWLVASILVALVLATVNRRSPSGPVVGETTEAAHVTSLSIGVVTAGVLPTFFMAALTQLPPGTASTAFLVGRIGTSVVGLTVNSVLLVRYRWDGAPRFDGRALHWAAILAAALLVTSTLSFPAGVAWLGYATSLAGWAVALVLGAIVVREANSRRQGRVLLVKSVVDLLVATAAAVVLALGPSFTGYFMAFAISQFVSTFICGLGLKLPRLVIASGIALLASTPLIIGGQ